MFSAFLTLCICDEKYEQLLGVERFNFMKKTFTLFFFKSSPEDIFIDFRERGRGREKHRCEGEISKY